MEAYIDACGEDYKDWSAFSRSSRPSSLWTRAAEVRARQSPEERALLMTKAEQEKPPAKQASDHSPAGSGPAGCSGVAYFEEGSS